MEAPSTTTPFTGRGASRDYVVQQVDVCHVFKFYSFLRSAPTECCHTGGAAVVLFLYAAQICCNVDMHNNAAAEAIDVPRNAFLGLWSLAIGEHQYWRTPLFRRVSLS